VCVSETLDGRQEKTLRHEQWRFRLSHSLSAAGEGLLVSETGAAGRLAEVPGLHLKLASAWEEQGDRAAALWSSLDAAERFLTLTRTDPAARAFPRARELSGHGRPGDRKRLLGRYRRLERLRAVH
jgi:hypothetical protein